MKKTIILGAFASLMMVSCAKDYTCKCTVTESTTGTSASATTTINGKKKDATAACEKSNSTQGTVSTKCEIQ
jgi:hypothetical protein